MLESALVMDSILDMRQKGFTLAELLVTVAVGAMLLAIGVPSYTTFVQNASQITAANELLASMHLARDIAITRNVRVTVCPSSDGTDCNPVSWTEGWIVFIDADGDRQADAGEPIERDVGGLRARSVTSAQFRDFLIFRPSGRVMVNSVAENTGELTFCDKRGAAHARVLMVDMSGRPRVSRKSADGDEPVCPDGV